MPFPRTIGAQTALKRTSGVRPIQPIRQVNQRRFESVDSTQPPQDIPSGPRWRAITTVVVGLAGAVYFMRMNDEVKMEKDTAGQGHGANQEYQTSAEGNR